MRVRWNVLHLQTEPPDVNRRRNHQNSLGNTLVTQEGPLVASPYPQEVTLPRLEGESGCQMGCAAYKRKMHPRPSVHTHNATRVQLSTRLDRGFVLPRRTAVDVLDSGESTARFAPICDVHHSLSLFR